MNILDKSVIDTLLNSICVRNNETSKIYNKYRHGELANIQTGKIVPTISKLGANDTQHSHETISNNTLNVENIDDRQPNTDTFPGQLTTIDLYTDMIQARQQEISMRTR